MISRGRIERHKMAERSADWIKQAMRDLESAKAQKLDGFYEWTCFISQQASGIPAEYIMEVNTLVAREPSVKSVILFGSVIESRATPASDGDIVIVVTKSNRPFHERSLEFVAYFEDIGLGTDIFVYTQGEITENDIPLYRTTLKHGRILYER